MKRYMKEAIIFLLQLFMFYIFPLFAGPTDMMGIVVLIILATLMLSVIIGILSNNKAKYLYPVLTAVLFIPSVFLYYNKATLVYSLWYLVVSGVGLLVGSIIHLIVQKVIKKN